MTFLNGILALGTLATLLPLVIHLLNRQRFETIDWAAMHFIAAVHQANKRRWRWHEIVLLMIRCAIPVLLALGLARPVLTAWRAPGATQPSTTVVLLDDSASMRQPLTPGTPGFTEARRRIEETLDQTAPNSEANVILTGGVFAGLADTLTTDLDDLREMLRQQEATTGSLDLRGGGQAAIDQLAAATNPWRRLLIFSDFASADWQPAGQELATALRSAFRDQPLPPEVLLVPLRGEPLDHNLAVTSITADKPHAVVGQTVGFSATIVSRGRTAGGTFPGHWSVDGVRQESVQATLETDDQVSLKGSFAFTETGTHRVRFAIDGQDAVPHDDAFDWIVFVDSPTEVLLVDGQPSREPLAGAADYLSIALTPFALARDGRTDGIRSRVVTVDELTAEALQTVDTLVLANVQKLDPQRTAELVEFVSRGGHLAAFLGDGIDPNWYDRLFQHDDAEPLLPVRLAAEAETTDPPLRVNFVADGVSFQPLREAVGDRLEGVEIGRYHGWRTSLPERADGTYDPRVDVVLRLSNGDPYLIQHRWQQGLVSLCAGPADADWSNWPMRPAFLPWVQSLLGQRHLTIDRSLNRPSGQSLIDRYRPEAVAESIEPDVRTSEGDPVAAEIAAAGGAVRVQTAPLRNRGVYAIRYGEEAEHLGSIFLPATESTRSTLSDTELAELAREMNAIVVSDATALAALQKERRAGREIWPWLLTAAMVLMLFEVFWQQSIRPLPRTTGVSR